MSPIPVSQSRRTGSRILREPEKESGLLFWYIADKPGTLYGNNSSLSSGWPDETGRFNLSASGLSGSDPLVFTNVINGHSVVRFNGTDDALKSSGSSVLIKHIFAVAKYTAATFSSYAGLITDLTSDGILVGDQGTSNFFNFNGTYRYNRAASAGRAAPMNAFGLVTAEYSTGWTAVPIIGQDRNNPGRFWQGDIVEIFGYDHVLATTPRDNKETYLHDTYSLP